MLTPADRAAILRLYDVAHRRQTGRHRFTLDGRHYSLHEIGAALADAWGIEPASGERYRELAIHYAGDKDGSPGRGMKFRGKFLASNGDWIIRRFSIRYQLPVR